MAKPITHHARQRIHPLITSTSAPQQQPESLFQKIANIFCCCCCNTTAERAQRQEERIREQVEKEEARRELDKMDREVAIVVSGFRESRPGHLVLEPPLKEGTLPGQPAPPATPLGRIHPDVSLETLSQETESAGKERVSMTKESSLESFDGLSPVSVNETPFQFNPLVDQSLL